jgi:hypothetical protein
MSQRSVLFSLFLTLPSFALSPAIGSAQQRPYTEGPVWFLTTVRTTAGFQDDYLRSLTTTWKRVIEEAKKQGIVVSYKVLSANASGPDDWDLLLMVELKNWAALDGIQDKFEPIEQKVVGAEGAQRQLATQRLEIRRILGSKNAQELILK